MFEDSFIRMLGQYPDAPSDKKKFTGLMKDFFPEQHMQVNLIGIAYDLGIASELEKTAHISNAFAFRFVKSMMDQYGVSRLNADWTISVWCVCYGQKTLNKPCDIVISKAKAGGAPSIREDKGVTGRQYNDLFRYTAVSDGYAISGFNGDNMRTLIIPNAHGGKPVTRIKAGAFANCDVQEVVMTDGITIIEEDAFKGCAKLKQVILPGTIREIGDAAFSGCPNLVTVALPKTLEQIGRYAFSGTALRQVDLPEGLLWLGDGAYMDCNKLTNATLPKHFAELAPKVFKGCASLKKMEMPDGIVKIGTEAFAGCAEMIDMIVPESVSSVGDNAFAAMNPGFRLICTQKSAAEQYARVHNVPFQIML